MSYIIVSMYTPNTPYEEEIKDLERCCNNFNLDYKFYPIHNTGDWTKNTQQKSDVIFKALKDFPDKDIVWLDADAVVFHYPKLFDELSKKDNFNLCIHKWNPRWIKDPKGEILSGTMYIKNNQKSLQMVTDWIEKNKTVVAWDQRTLHDVIHNNESYVIIQLPQEYVKIKSRTQSINQVSGIIGHKQVSRQHRNSMGSYK